MNTRTHGILDYIVGAILAVSPWVFGFAEGGVETWLPVSLGILAVAYSLVTNYELGLIRIVPMSMHLVLDFLSGVLLAASPWVFGFADRVFAPHLSFGVMEISAALMTRQALTSAQPVRE